MYTEYDMSHRVIENWRVLLSGLRRANIKIGVVVVVEIHFFVFKSMQIKYTLTFKSSKSKQKCIMNKQDFYGL